MYKEYKILHIPSGIVHYRKFYGGKEEVTNKLKSYVNEYDSILIFIDNTFCFASTSSGGPDVNLKIRNISLIEFEIVEI